MNAKVAKKVRHEVKKLEQKLASEFKDWTKSLGWIDRFKLGWNIFWKIKW